MIYPPRISEKCVWVDIDEMDHVDQGVARISWIDRRNWRERPLEFTWRGRDSGTGEIQWDERDNHGEVTFTSVHICSGVLTAWGERLKFAGYKVSSRTPSDTVDECRDNYNRLTEKRWLRESTSRWGGGSYDSSDDSGEERENRERYVVAL